MIQKEKSMTPDFDAWNEQKQKIHHNKRLPSFKTGEIWWCAVGKDIGRESYGKWQLFARPIYIFKKISRELFFGIPLTSQEKIGTWFHKIETHDKTRYAILSQMRVFSANRLLEQILTLRSSDQEKIKNTLKEYLQI